MKNLLIILSILICNSVFPQWIEVNSNTSENLHDIFFMDDLTGYCVGGGTSTGMPAGSGVVMKTTDGGENWTTIFSDDSLAILNVGVITESTYSKLYAFARKNGQSYLVSTFVSTEFQNWTVEPIDYKPVIVRVYDEKIYFMDLADELRLKRISNNQVETLRSDIGYFNINSSGIVAFNGGRTAVFKSLDFGLTWSEPSPIPMFHPSDLAMFNDTIIYTNTYDPATFFSFDGGAVWNSHYGGPISYSLIVSTNLFFSHLLSSVYYTNNTGEGWTWMGEFDISKIYIKDNLGFMIGPDGTIYKLGDLGPLGVVNPFEKQINIFPNPSSTELRIELSDGLSVSKMNLIHSNGKVVKTAIGYQSHLDLSELSVGLYILQIQTNKGNVSKRIVVGQ